MDKIINAFTSTGMKLLHHPYAVAMIKETGRIPALTIQIAPTSRCNLKCEFCSNVNRNIQEDLSLDTVSDMFDVMLYLKSVEWTGGGDPTMYKGINYLIALAREHKLKQGFITNGLALDNLTDTSLGSLFWIRISMNCLDYVPSDKLSYLLHKLEAFKGTLGFSYVVNERTPKNIKAILDWEIGRFNPKYVRIVPNCQATDEEQERNNREISAMVSEWGKPYLYQTKTFDRPERCWWGYIKPFVLHDGWVYPCSSVVLNADADRQFHEKYRWMEIKDLPQAYAQNPEPFPTVNCNHCVFREQNDIVDDLLNPSGQEDFV